MKRFFAFLLIFVLMFSFSGQAIAATLEDTKEELEDVNKEIKEANKKLDKVEKEQKSASEQLMQLERNLEAKEKELKRLESKLAENLAVLQQTESELAAAEKELQQAYEELEAVKQELEEAKEAAKEQEELMAERLRVMYMDKNTSYLELLFESKSLNDFFVKLDMIKQMIAYDNQVLEDMNKAKEEIEQKQLACENKTRDIELKKTQIEEKKAYLEQKKKEISSERTLVSRQKASIESDQKEKERLLKELEKEKERINKELDELEQLSKELEKKIKELTEKSKEKYSGGVMAWPMPGYSYISSDYGYRIHPITNVYKMHTGIDIAGSNIYGKSAVAAADGVVILAQYYGSYGNTVIIDHGSGITTLYAHGSAFKVSVGQKVKKGDPVLAVGSTGASTGPHLHFEVRINGAHTNPWPYLRGN